MTQVIRFDRGQLRKPQRQSGTLVVEGHAARVHRPGDPLRYAHGDEYRDRAELQRIVDQLPGVPVTIPHPPGLIRDGAKARVVGRVDAAWIDGEHAAVRMTVTDASAARSIDDGTRELSLGYACGVRADGHQDDTEVDHLAIVERARCGATCSLRTDERLDCSSTCACQIDRSHAVGELGHNERETMADEKTDKQRADELETTVTTLTGEVKRLEGLIAANATAAETSALRKEKARADAADENVRKLEAKFDANVRARVALVTQATTVMGREFRMDDLSDRQIHEAVIKRLDASVNVGSENDDQVRGRFNTLLTLAARNVESQARVAEILGRTTETARKDDSESYESIENNRWKKTLSNGRATAAEGR